MNLQTNKGLSLPYSCNSPLAVMSGSYQTAERRGGNADRLLREKKEVYGGREPAAQFWGCSSARPSPKPRYPARSFLFLPKHTNHNTTPSEDTHPHNHRYPPGGAPEGCNPVERPRPGLCNRPHFGCEQSPLLFTLRWRPLKTTAKAPCPIRSFLLYSKSPTTSIIPQRRMKPPGRKKGRRENKGGLPPVKAATAASQQPAAG